MNQMPEAFGLHANANLVAAISETLRLLSTAASLQPKTAQGGGGSSPDEIITEAKDIGDFKGYTAAYRAVLGL